LRPRTALDTYRAGDSILPVLHRPERKRDLPHLVSLDLASLDVVDIVLEIELEFTITIPDEDAHSSGTVGELIPYVKDRTG